MNQHFRQHSQRRPNGVRIRDSARGLTLIEVLIAIVVLSIGLLGLASLQGVTLKLIQGSFHRTQATNLAYEITDQMRANRASALDYAGTYSAVTCNTAFSRSGSLAAADIAEWRNALACSLPGGWASIKVNNVAGSANRFEVEVEVGWEEARLEEVTDQLEEVTDQLRFSTEL